MRRIVCQMLATLSVVLIVLQVAFLIALATTARTLQEVLGIRAVSWIALYLFLSTCGSYLAGPLLSHLVNLSVEAGRYGFTTGELVASFNYLHLLFRQLAAFGLLILLLADLSHLLQGANVDHTSKLVRHYEFRVGLATVVLAVAYPAILASLIMSL
jgi:hypothetical protein